MPVDRRVTQQCAGGCGMLGYARSWRWNKFAPSCPALTQPAPTPASNIQVLGEGGAVLDEAEAGLGLGAHQRVDGFCHLLLRVGDLDPQERAQGWVHGRLLELGGVHLAQPLEAA